MPRSSAKSAGKSIYSVHPTVAMVRKWEDTLAEKSGRSLEQWIALVRKQGPPDEKSRRAWLKEVHSLGTNSAWWIAGRADGKGVEDGDPALYLKAAVTYVDDMYAGSKAALRPVHDALIDLCRSLGKDVKVCPCTTVVPLYRNHVFAQVKPTTRTRIDFGLALKGAEKDAAKCKRLIDTGGLQKKDRITHRFAIASLEDIDAEVRKWLKRAYALDA